MFPEEKLSQRSQKTAKHCIKSFYSNTYSGFEHKKNCVNKLSIKMFIKRENRTGKAYASFKKLVAYNFFYNFTPDNCVRCEAVLVGYDSMPDIVRC